MNPAFTHAVVYEIIAHCRTPLRTGSADNAPDAILTDSQGRYLLSGTSIAGALRNWVSDPRTADLLFGSNDTAGHLHVSDGVFEEDTQTSLRPRLRIDGATGTAAANGNNDGCKFDTLHICTGSCFRFTVTWTGTEQELPQTQAVEQSLSALDTGQILLGAEKSNGFGRVNLEVRKRVFCMTNAEDRTVWMGDQWTGKPFLLPRISCSHQVVFQIHASAPRILTKSGALEYKTQQLGDKDVSSGSAVNLRENGVPVVPGSGFKGAVLQQLRSIADYLQVPRYLVENAFGAEATEDQEGIAGRFRFRDIALEDQPQAITRIRIDRFTGGVMTGGLFKSEPLSSRFTAEIYGPDDQPEACALLLYSLRDLGLGLYNLGSGWAIGYGLLKVEKITAALDDRTLTLSFDAQGNITLDDPDGLSAKWLQALGGVCDEN